MTIGDIDGSNSVTFGFSIPEIMFGLSDQQAEAKYWEQNKHTYNIRHMTGQQKILEFLSVQEQIQNIFDNHDIDCVYAYNAMFDIGALDRTLNFINGDSKLPRLSFLPEEVKVKCIQRMACHSLFLTKEYTDWCEQSGCGMTKTGFISTSVEGAYRYLFGNPDYEEIHIGTDDSFQEYQILCWLMKHYPEAPNRPLNSAWIIPNLDRIYNKKGAKYWALKGVDVDYMLKKESYYV